MPVLPCFLAKRVFIFTSGCRKTCSIRRKNVTERIFCRIFYSVKFLPLIRPLFRSDYDYKNRLSKDSGSISESLYSLYSRFLLPRITRKSSEQNSLITCLHTPQGGQNSVQSPFLPPTIAMALNSVSLRLNALNIATRSAQMVGV